MSNIQEQVAAFDCAVKRRLMSGEAPELAVPDAATEVGLTLEPERVDAIVRVLRLAQIVAKDPEFIRKRDALTERIRHLARSDGMTISRAVKQAQDDTGVKLSDAGQRILIETLEQESEKLAGTMVEVISDKEFQEMENAQRCVSVQGVATKLTALDGKPGWLCCHCSRSGRGTLNGDERASCRTCNHGRCDAQRTT